MNYHPPEMNTWPHIVVVGGGFGGIELIKKLRKSNCRITLIDKHNYHTFQPLLYQVASGGLGADAIGYPFRLIFRGQQNFRFLHSEVKQIIAERKLIETEVGQIQYDHLVLATGSTTNYFGNKEIEHYSMPMKSIPEALNLRSDLLEECEAATRSQDTDAQRKRLRFVVVGGGPTGVETAGSLAEFKNTVMKHDYPELDPKLMEVYLVEASANLLNGMRVKSGEKAKGYLEKLGVIVKTGVSVSSYKNEVVLLSDGSELPSNTLVWAAGVKGQLIAGLPDSSVVGSRFQVDEFHKLKGTDNIYAIGDSAGMSTADRPKGHPMVAPVAVQQGSNLAANFKRSLKGLPLQKFRYNDNGSMATVGRNKAVVDLPSFSFGGFAAWLVWMFLHLMLLVGFRNRVVVFIDWMWSYLTYERALRLIVRKYNITPEANEL
jgi:NADH dehydrogenase